MSGYRDLEIYKESKRLAILVHRMTMNLPKFEMYEEGGQARRSSKSVTSMIVEGYGRRRYKAEYIKYLTYSQGECDETIVHLEFLIETGSAEDTDEVASLIREYDVLSKKINKYTQWVEDNFNPYRAGEPDLTTWPPGNRHLVTGTGPYSRKDKKQFNTKLDHVRITESTITLHHRRQRR